MKFKINDRDWEIVEASQAKMCEVEGVEEDARNKFFGLCCYDSQTIYIWEDLHPQQKRETLLHELFHCYIGVYCSFEDMQWNIDIICNLVGNSHDIIHKIVEDYFDTKIKMTIDTPSIALLKEQKEPLKGKIIC